MEQLQFLETVLERDIDLLILEELNCNPSFRDWFISELDIPKIDTFKKALRSISNFNLGETDIMILFDSNGKKIIVLVENKLDSNFQEKQFERYEQRGIRYLEEQTCSEYFIVLIAPNQYVESQNEFEKFITYEQIQNFFNKEQTERSKYKSEILQIGIEKLRRGYQPINSDPVQNFMQKYWIHKEIKFPKFKMKKPIIVPLGSDWVEMRNEEQKGIIYYHKLNKGFVDATFCNFPSETIEKVKSTIPQEYVIEKHKSGRFSIRQKVDSICRTEEFDTQIEKVELGLRKIKEVSDLIKSIGY